MAIGMNRETGKSIDGVDHLRQSTDILTTRIGQRVVLRKYGSNLPELVDLPEPLDHRRNARGHHQRPGRLGPRIA